MATSEVLRAVHQVMLPGFTGTSVPDWLAEALSNGLAGVVYFSHNITSPAQIRALSEQIAALNPAAVIATDEEGGDVTRLQHDAGSSVPGAALLGAVSDPGLTEAAGRSIGALCAAAGVNLTLAPDVDVNTNPANPVIGVRSFGSDPGKVSKHASAMVRGIQAHGQVAACAKHFPGHGDTVTDSHLGLPRVSGELNDFLATHLPPFQAAIAAGVRAVMSAHIVVDGLGEEPATINPRAMALLRDEGFDGVIVTDALDMAAIREGIGSGEGAVQAILAGADLLCIGNPHNQGNPDNQGEPDNPASEDSQPQDLADFQQVRDALVEAVEAGRISLQRLAESAQRSSVLGGLPAKPDHGIGDADEVQVAGGAGIGEIATPGDSPRAVDWLGLTISACLTASANPEGAPPSAGVAFLGGKPTWRLADLRTTPNQAVGARRSYFAQELARHRGIEQVPADAKHLDIVLVDALYPGSSQLRALRGVLASSPSVICINAGVPLNRSTHASSASAGAVLDLPSTAVVLNCFGTSPLTAEAVARILTGD